MSTENSRCIDPDCHMPHIRAPDGESPDVSRRATVLIVDDDEMVVDYLSHVIAAAGYAVVSATSAQAALVALQSGLARIVIIDVMMPVMDGLELCRSIRS